MGDESKIVYDIDALRNGIKRCYKNIGTFNDAIQGEHNTIQEYERMISSLEELAQKRKDYDEIVRSREEAKRDSQG